MNSVPPLPSPDPKLAWIQGASALLAERRVMGLVGDAGAGTSGAAAALARLWPGPVVWARLLGCRDQDDVQRAIGAALGLAVRGDPAGISERLAHAAGLLIVLDEADAQGVPEALEALSALTGQATVLLTGRGAAAAIEMVRVPGPGRRLTLPDPVPPLARAAALLPAGLKGATPPPDWPAQATLPQADGFCLTRGAVEAILDAGVDARAAATLVLPMLRPLLELARGGHLWEPPDEREVLALRLVAEWHPDADLATRAATTAVRVLAAAGQLGLALHLASNARALDASPLEQALLDWAEADVLLDYGLTRESESLHLRAEQQLWAVDAAEDALCLLRRRAADSLVRGESRMAASLAERAAQEAEALGMALQHGAALRIQGDAALAWRDTELAESLYSRADSVLRGRDPNEAFNLGIGRASLALLHADPGTALSLLDALEPQRDLHRAALSRRRGDIALRTGQHTDAAAHYAQASDTLLRLGQRAAAAAALRAEADAHAAAGRPAQAARSWRRALQQACRAGDLNQAQHVLQHWVDLERDQGSPAREAELLGLMHELDLELHSGGESTAERTAPAP